MHEPRLQVEPARAVSTGGADHGHVVTGIEQPVDVELEVLEGLQEHAEQRAQLLATAVYLGVRERPHLVPFDVLVAPRHDVLEPALVERAVDPADDLDVVVRHV